MNDDTAARAQAQPTPEERASRANDRSRRYEMNLEPAIAHEIREAEQAAYERGREDEREACAEIADEWGRGSWQVDPQDGRQRFEIHHLQQHVNSTGRGIAEDIRKRGDSDG